MKLKLILDAGLDFKGNSRGATLVRTIQPSLDLLRKFRALLEFPRQEYVAIEHCSEFFPGIVGLEGEIVRKSYPRIEVSQHDCIVNYKEFGLIIHKIAVGAFNWFSGEDLQKQELLEELRKNGWEKE